MAGREERPAREPRPEREHPIGKALYACNREGWGYLFQTHKRGIRGDALQQAKDSLKAELDAVKGLIDAM